MPFGRGSARGLGDDQISAGARKPIIDKEYFCHWLNAEILLLYCSLNIDTGPGYQTQKYICASPCSKAS